MLKYHVARLAVGVADGIHLMLTLLTGLNHHAFGDLDARHWTRFHVVIVFDPHGLVYRVREQSSFLRLQRVEQALAGKGVAVEYVECTVVECQTASVLDPQGPQGPR